MDITLFYFYWNWSFYFSKSFLLNFVFETDKLGTADFGKLGINWNFILNISHLNLVQLFGADDYLGCEISYEFESTHHCSHVQQKLKLNVSTLPEWRQSKMVLEFIWFFLFELQVASNSIRVTWIFKKFSLFYKLGNKWPDHLLRPDTGPSSDPTLFRKLCEVWGLR